MIILENGLLDLMTVADCLGKCEETIKRMAKKGDLEAVSISSGKKGRPKTMITASSYGRYLLRKAGN